MSFPLDIIPVMDRTTITGEHFAERPLPHTPEKPTFAQKAWRKILETMQPDKRKKRKAVELGAELGWSTNRLDKTRDAAEGADERGSERRRSWTTLSTYVQTVGGAENEAEEDDTASSVWSHGSMMEEVTHREERKDGQEADDITALPPMPPQANVESPTTKARKLTKRKAPRT